MTALYQAPLTPMGNTMVDPNYGPTANPYFTTANQFLPRNLHDVIRWSKYITMQSPVTTEVIRKLATYPITEFVVKTKNEKVKEKYQDIFKTFDLKATLHGIGFDYYTIGNVFVSIYFPILRTLTCPSCNQHYPAKKAEFTTFKQYKFNGKCPACNYVGDFPHKDSQATDVADINLIKWDAMHIVVNHNPITGESEYYYKIPNEVKRRVQTGDKLFVNSIPWSLIEAIKNNQDYKFDRNRIFHLKNNSSGHSLNGISVPPLISLFSLVYYQATLRKANESISSDFMNPLRVLYPTAQTGQSDPVVSMSMRNFASNMQEAVIKHRRDKNHVLISPVPVGYQAVSGEGRNLLVSQEIQQAEESILLSLGVSRELLSGQTNWTSSTVGLRLLENTMLSYTAQILGLVNWVMSATSRYLTLEECVIDLTPFRLTDDDNLKQLLINLVGSQSASLSSLYEAMGMDYAEELNKIKEDAITKAVHDVQVKMEVDRAAFIASREAVDKFDKDNDYRTALTKAQGIAGQLEGADPATKRAILNQLQVEEYPQFLLISKLLEEYSEQAQAQVQQDQSQTQDPNAQASGSDSGQDGTQQADTQQKQPQGRQAK